MNEPGTQQIRTHSGATFENLDRCVLFAAIGGVILNGFEASQFGMILVIVAAIIYGLVRNRINNINAFEYMDDPPACMGINSRHFTLWCQWLASRQLRDGLLGDLVDPAIGSTPQAAHKYLREMFCLAAWIRIKEKVLTLLWLDRHF